LTDFIAVLTTERSQKAGSRATGGTDASVGNYQKQVFQGPSGPRAGCDDDGGDTKHRADHPSVSPDVVVVNPLGGFLHGQNSDA